MSPDNLRLLREFSEKNFDFSKVVRAGKRSRRVKSVEEGEVTSDSGYLVVSEACNIEAYSDLPFAKRTMGNGGEGRGKINLNSPIWYVPKMMQGDGFVAFRNLYGDGCFGVVSSQRRFYVETDLPTSVDKDLIDEIKNNTKEKIGSRFCQLEGLVCVRSGGMIVTDPMYNPVEYPDKDNISAILTVRPGVYICKFIGNGKKLAIARKS